MISIIPAVGFVLALAGMIIYPSKARIREQAYLFLVIFFAIAIVSKEVIIELNSSSGLAWWLSTRFTDGLILALLITGIIMGAKKPRGGWYATNI